MLLKKAELLKIVERKKSQTSQWANKRKTRKKDTNIMWFQICVFISILPLDRQGRGDKG